MSEPSLPSETAHIIRTEPADAHVVGGVDCGDEPIRVPGSIQPHGFLLGLERGKETVVLVSENVSELLGLPSSLVIGSPIELFLERELLASIRSVLGKCDPDGLLTYLGSFRIGNGLFSVLTHRVGTQRLLEFERLDRLVGPEMMNGVMTNFVATLGKLKNERDVCQAITEQIAELTGFDRVLLYSFDSVGHGTVHTEVNNGVLPSYLDLRFPATDIPAQARALYVENTVRIIPNAEYTPIPLRAPAGQDGVAVDMSLCVLRSVSPVHLEYMRNMGTWASMSISIVCDGRLWGLISCHNAQPKLVPFLIRSACDLLSKMVGTQISVLETATRLRTLVKYHDIQRNLLTQIAAEHDYLGAMFGQLDLLTQVTDADGVALVLDGDIQTAGITPPTTAIRKLVAWFNERPELETLETNTLSDELPFAMEIKDTASGLIAIRISEVRERYVLWFRQEIVRTVQWAGQPVKGVDEANRLHPRTSFQSWQEIVRGQGSPWQTPEIDSAREFRAALSTIGLRRAEEEAELSAARFNKLTHTLPIKIFTVTDDGVLSYANAQWQGKGLRPTGVWYENGNLLPEDIARCAGRWQQAVEHESDFEEEVRFVEKNASGEEQREVWNLVRVVPFRRKGANRAGWIGAAIDLTERKEHEANLRITDKLALTSRLTSFFAHEINNPLEAITNVVFLLKLQAAGDQETQHYLAILEEEFGRISSVVKQTLRWTSENSDKMQWASVKDIYDDVVVLFSAKIRNRNVLVECLVVQDLRVYGIVGQIRQALAHLLSNAIDAVPVGGEIVLDARQHGSSLEMSVHDNGPGIAAEDRARLFQPFFSTKGDLGNGLGLYISKEIAERHAGDIQIESAQGRGTTARFTIPWAPSKT